jgi:hypothetical protein
VSSDDYIVNDDQRFDPTIARSLEGRNEVCRPLQWQQHKLKTELSARSSHFAHGQGGARVAIVPEGGHSGNVGESFFEKPDPFCT